MEDSKPLDDMVTRVLAAMIKVGVLDNPVCNLPDCDEYLYAVNTSSAANTVIVT